MGKQDPYLFFLILPEIITFFFWLFDFDKIIHDILVLWLVNIIRDKVENHAKKGCEMDIQFSIGCDVG